MWRWIDSVWDPVQNSIPFLNTYFILFVLDLACDPTRTADVAAIVMQEGTAQSRVRQWCTNDDVYIIAVSLHVINFVNLLSS